ncbi:MAG: 2-amino-4-hydroxy-6-hydroxymethyldihydropteridine diphosphokinase [bacterium]|nr:2-amino-4-hydroxy-6-hydroxymethyldihydropteridine diphosphokinase [bacterium]
MERKTRNDFIYLSLGSNQGNREMNLERAVEKLAQQGVRIVRLSSLYETEPVGFPDQPCFLNKVAECDTSLSPEKLLQAIQQVENEMGRVRTCKWGPRTIDIDILFYKDCVFQRKDLLIPHPEIENRNFILVPLAELNPELFHPVSRKRLKDLISSKKGAVNRLK